MAARHGVFLLLLVIVIQTVASKRKVICEDSKTTLSCPLNQVINIRQAWYGRYNKRTCKHKSIKTTRCSTNKPRGITRKNCNGRKSCTVAANNRLYGDPCPGTHKYVTVTYYCKVKKTPKCLRRCHRQAKCIRRKCVCKSGYKGDGIRSCTNIKDECSYPYRRVGKGCYLIQKDNVSGDTAFAKCLQRGAYLANFETLNEAMLMKYELLKMKTGVHYYVGGRNINRYKTGGDWRWIKKDGEMVKMKYFAFDNGEPNGTLKASQDCMFFYASRGYRFHAVWCAMGGILGGYICEK